MQVEMKILKITKTLHGDCSTSFGIVKEAPDTGTQNAFPSS
jgi:hypothetical protein